MARESQYNFHLPFNKELIENLRVAILCGMEDTIPRAFIHSTVTLNLLLCLSL